MYTIGQFSRITGLSIKTVRLYHEKGLLEPACVDQFTGYRYFNDHNVETARAIAYLREMQFPLSAIHEIICHFHEDSEILPFLEKQKETIEIKIRQLNQTAESLENILHKEKEVAHMVRNDKSTIVEKQLPDEGIISLRWKGKYSETGKMIGQVARRAGRVAGGPPFNLYYDLEHKEEDADIESGFPVRPGKKADHILPGGRCLSLLHRGPYEQLGLSYQQLFDYLQTRGYEARAPIREIYLKGPGMIFRGNPKNYLTEIQILIEEPKEKSDENQGQ